VKKSYVFSLLKGCSCFDFDLPFHLLATASYNSYIFIWNYYSTKKPISILRGHIGTIISLKIQPAINYLYSLSNDSVLKAWDIKKETCIQSVNLDFLSLQANLDYGQNPMLFYTDPESKHSGLLISCCDYIGKLPIGEVLTMAKQMPVTHSSPISTMVYCDLMQVVVTCTESSDIVLWNVCNGKRILTVKNAHGNEEITFCCVDKSQRRL